MSPQPLTVGTVATSVLPCSPSEKPVAASTSIPTRALEKACDEWLLDCEYRFHSPRTLETRRVLLKNLLWFLDHRKFESCDTRELKQFFHYLRHGHEEPNGRWGNKQCKASVRPETVKDYWLCINTLFKWLVAEGALQTSPMSSIPKPVVRLEEKQPLTQEQAKALLRAARNSLHPLRDQAIVLLLLDTGIRNTELVELKLKHIDLRARHCIVTGKGNKVRTVHFGMATGNALRLYLRSRSGADEEPVEDEPAFRADKCGQAIRPLTRSGLQQLLERLGKASGITRGCSPHVLRRTFAVSWLRNGGNIFSLQAMLGHSDLRMTQRYLSLARADIAEQARQFSPADRLARR